MRTTRIGYWRPLGPPPVPWEPRRHSISVMMLSAFGIASVANALTIITGVPFLVSLIVAIILKGVMLRALRPAAISELTINGEREIRMSYFILATIFIAMSACGLYWFGRAASEQIANRSQSPHGAASPTLPVMRRLKRKEQNDAPSQWRLTSEGEDASSADDERSEDSPLKTVGQFESLRGFVEATFATETAAIVWWIVAFVIELLIYVLTRADHLDYEYWE